VEKAFVLGIHSPQNPYFMKSLQKTFALLTLVFVMFGVAQAQNTSDNLPKEGAVLRVENNQIKAGIGKTTSVDFQIIRSKFYQKQQFPIELMVSAPAGFEISITPASNTADSGKLEIKVDKSVPVGQYTLTIQKNPKSRFIVKGLMLNVTVSEDDSAKGQK
jgi:hypothetical protein